MPKLPTIVKINLSFLKGEIMEEQYSGDNSREFWAIVNFIDDEDSTLYKLGCNLQNLESRMFRRIKKLRQIFKARWDSPVAMVVAQDTKWSAQNIHQQQLVILSCSGCGFEGWYGKECNNCSRSTHLVDKYTPK